MKSYTPPVVGEKPPKVGFFARLNGKVSCVYYEGRDPQENVYALWIEGEGLGGLLIVKRPVLVQKIKIQQDISNVKNKCCNHGVLLLGKLSCHHYSQQQSK